MARVLVLTQFFPPETTPGARRMGALVEVLAHHHDVVVTTLKPSYPDPALYDSHSPADDSHRPYRVRRTFRFKPHSESLVTRAVREHAMAAVLTASALREPADVVLASSPSMFLGPTALALARLKSSLFVLDLRDLHWRLVREVEAAGSSSARRLAIEALGQYMWYTVRRADLIVSATPGITEVLLAEGIPEGRILTITNTISQDVFDRLSAIGEAAPGARPVVSYVGLIGYSQGLEVLLDAARRLPEVDFVIAGDGSKRRELEDDARRRKLANVSFPGYLDAEHVADLYRRSGVLFVQTRDSTYTNSTVIPVKLFEYMAASRPILYAGTGLAVEFLERARCAVIVPPGDGKALADAISDLTADPARMRELGRRGRQFVEEAERREQTAERLVEALSERLADRGSGNGARNSGR